MPKWSPEIVRDMETENIYNKRAMCTQIDQAEKILLVGPVEKQIGSCGLTGGESMPMGGIDCAPR